MKLTTQRDVEMASVENMGDAISERLGPKNPRFNKRSGQVEPSGEMIRFAGPERVRLSVKPKNEIMQAIFGNLGGLRQTNKYGYMGV